MGSFSYLYDTFEGFDKEDVKIELESQFTGETYMKKIGEYFAPEDISSDEKMAIVKNKMLYPERCIFRKGYFPETTKDDIDLKFIFVSLDMDLYKPILDGIMFFYPRLEKGGYIFIHDYNNNEFQGVKKALQEAESVLGEIPYFPLADEGGTVVLYK